MAVMPRETWTDERLDDLKGQMKERFDHVDAEMDQRFKQVDQSFDRVEDQMKEMRGDIKTTQRLMTQGFIGICTLMGTGFAITVTGIGILAL
jgi:hypothetical protein